MLSSPFFRRLFLPYLLLICAAIGTVGLVGAARLRASYLEQTEHALRDSSRLVADLLAGELNGKGTGQLQAMVRRIGAEIGCRVTVIAEDGTVLADNEADPARMENHRLRPEVMAAASRGEGSRIRPSDTIHQDLFYFARKVGWTDGSSCFIRLAVHLAELDRHLRAFYLGIGLAAALAMLGTGIICYLVARRQAAPLVQLTGFAEALGRGQLEQRIISQEKGEIGRLGGALNAMADALSRLLAETANDKAQLLAVLGSMSEGVIATDERQRVLLSNGSAGRLLDFQPESAAGKPLWELVRVQPMLEGAGEVLQTRQRRGFQTGPVSGRHLEVTICTFPLAGGGCGLVIVAHDATETVRYQELRKEFVANVSHELRTPLTAIKGYAETLRDGAMSDPLRGPQFLATIEKHADQLTNLVQDLLELSRLESLPGLPRPVAINVPQVVRKAAELLRPAAQRKQQRLDLEAPEDLPAVAGNADYLERAVANLVDNAVKYTPEGGRIDIGARREGTQVIIEVRDNGIGIPAADIPRIFERFYRVDRSRSREMGGTGLGLSIVKHIAQAHRGCVEVRSTPGEGSTFRLRLPIVS